MPTFFFFSFIIEVQYYKYFSQSMIRIYLSIISTYYKHVLCKKKKKKNIHFLWSDSKCTFVFLVVRADLWGAPLWSSPEECVHETDWPHGWPFVTSSPFGWSLIHKLNPLERFSSMAVQTENLFFIIIVSLHKNLKSSVVQHFFLVLISLEKPWTCIHCKIL